MKETLFHFKNFFVNHGRSSMKVGVDGVLIGAWATPDGIRVLDVGTGCGLIALMIAQRNQQAQVLAIDIDASSIEEANENFKNSKWGERIRGLECSFLQLRELDWQNLLGSSNPFSGFNDKEPAFDLLISNPPFFDSGIENPSTPRMKARHQGDLSPDIILRTGESLLAPGGAIAMIVPSEFYYKLKSVAEENGLSLSRACFVRGHAKSPEKRVMMEFVKRRDGLSATEFSDVEVSHLVMFDDSHLPTDEYKALCKDFYLKF